MATTLKKLVSDLSHIGPKRVMRGDLADAGLQGVIFAPAGRTPAPTAIVIADWMTPLSAYHELARHLASWGVACVVPKVKNTGLNDADEMADQIVALVPALKNVKLGNSTAQLNSDRLALVGHGLGAAAVAEVAARGLSITCVVAAYPTDSSPSPLTYTPQAKVPALVICPENPPLLSVDIAEDFAQSWGSSVVMRKVPGCTRMGMTGNSLLERFGLSETNAKKPLQTQLSLVTGYVCYQLTGKKEYAGFASADADIPGTEVEPIAREEQEPTAKQESKCPFARLMK